MIPDWYLIFTAVVFSVILLAMAAIGMLAFRLLQVVKRLEPQVDSLMLQVNGDVLPKVSGLVTKVDALASNVDSLTVSVKSIADSTKGHVDAIGSRALAVSDAVSVVSTAGASKLQGLAPYLGLIMAGLKVYQSLAASRPRGKKRKSLDA